MNQESRSYDFLWLGIALFPLLGLSFLFDIQPQDFWWLMRVGQDTLQSGAVPLTDAISWSQMGLPIFYQPWLSGVLLYLTYNLGSITSIFILRGVLIGITYSLTWMMARDVSNARTATILVFILGIASANNWSIRSQLFVYPLFMLCLWSLNRWQNENKKHLWSLPIVTLLWANLHGSFVLLFALAGTALLFGSGNKKNLLIAFGAMLLATFFNLSK